MTAGTAFLVLSLIFALAAAVSWGRGKAAAGKALALASFFAAALASAWLFWLILHDRFDIDYVWSYSSLDLPLVYKVSAFWAGQQGSFLLWLFFHAAAGAALAIGALGGGFLAPTLGAGGEVELKGGGGVARGASGSGGAATARAGGTLRGGLGGGMGPLGGAGGLGGGAVLGAGSGGRLRRGGSAVADRGDELALAHTGGALEAHRGGELLQLGQAHCSQGGGAGSLSHECPHGVARAMTARGWGRIPDSFTGEVLHCAVPGCSLGPVVQCWRRGWLRRHGEALWLGRCTQHSRDWRPPPVRAANTRRAATVGTPRFRALGPHKLSRPAPAVSSSQFEGARAG